MKKCLIITEGNDKIGYGRIKRCEDIAFELKERGWEVDIKKNIISHQEDRYSPNRPKLIIIDIENKDGLVFPLEWVDIRRIYLYDETDPTLPSFTSYITYPVYEFRFGADSLEYFPIRREFQNPKKKVIKDKVENILLTFGGADPNNYTEKVMRILIKHRIHLKCRIKIILPNELELLCNEFHNIKIYSSVKNMREQMEWADLAICSGGNTLVELISQGVPSIVLPQNENEKKHAEWFFNNSLILAWTKGDLLKIIIDYLEQYTKKDVRETISENAQNYVDGLSMDRFLVQIDDDLDLCYDCKKAFKKDELIPNVDEDGAGIGIDTCPKCTKEMLEVDRKNNGGL